MIIILKSISENGSSRWPRPQDYGRNFRDDWYSILQEENSLWSVADEQLEDLMAEEDEEEEKSGSGAVGLQGQGGGGGGGGGRRGPAGGDAPDQF